MIEQILLLTLQLLATDSTGVKVGADFHAAAAFRPVLPGANSDLGLVERYSENWAARRMEPEEARRWEDLPAFGSVDLRGEWDSVKIFANIPLRRDIDAWRQDPSGSNLVLSVPELDINIPYEGWISWTSAGGASIRAGRFRQTYSPSPYGVVLGSNLVHDGVALRIPLGRWTFDWFASSLNPWLAGTDANGVVDSGSEAALQRTRTVSNQRGRIYDDSYKTLLFHKLSCALGAWELSIGEQLIVGGVAPQWREAVPFIVWHNNYGDGYSKVSTNLQVLWNPAKSAQFHLQGVFEDVQVPVGEAVGADPRVVYGANLGWKGEFERTDGRWSSLVDLTVTSATFNNHRIPLLRGVSRRLYRSNNRSQDQPGFVDTWVVDRPLGYFRGSDAVDLWTRLDWTSPDGTHGAGLEIDWLNRGDAAVWMDGDPLDKRQGPLSGEVTTEVRLLSRAWLETSRRWKFEAGIGIVYLDEPDGQSRETGLEPVLDGAVSVGF